ncbi:serine/threonine-protein kinase [Streptomyces sp. GLT-R25]
MTKPSTDDFDATSGGVGDRIGRYRLLRNLGAGGMGRVCLARSEGGRTVAVKLIKPELAAEPEFRERFRLEVAAARRVSDRWTAPVLDADTEAETPWVATGYIAGPSLEHIVSPQGHGPLPAPSVRTLAHGLASALLDIHGAGLVHRDLKPSNVLITIDGPRVIDFGIARALDAVPGSTPTSSGVLVGSPRFMSPEQLRDEPVGPASDVFCMGTGPGVCGDRADPVRRWRFRRGPRRDVPYRAGGTGPDGDRGAGTGTDRRLPRQGPGGQADSTGGRRTDATGGDRRLVAAVAACPDHRRTGAQRRPVARHGHAAARERDGGADTDRLRAVARTGRARAFVRDLVHRLARDLGGTSRIGAVGTVGVGNPGRAEAGQRARGVNSFAEPSPSPNGQGPAGRARAGGSRRGGGRRVRRVGRRSPTPRRRLGTRHWLRLERRRRRDIRRTQGVRGHLGGRGRAGREAHRSVPPVRRLVGAGGRGRRHQHQPRRHLRVQERRQARRQAVRRRYVATTRHQGRQQRPLRLVFGPRRACPHPDRRQLPPLGSRGKRTAELHRIEGPEKLPEDLLGTWQRPLANGGTQRMTIERTPVGSPAAMLVSDGGGEHCEADMNLVSVGDANSPARFAPPAIDQTASSGPCLRGGSSTLRTEGDTLVRELADGRRLTYTRA